MAAPEEPKNVCKLCKVVCSSALQLCEHVAGFKHRARARQVCSVGVSQMNRLQFFLDTYVPQEPLVGLEFVEEMEMKRRFFYKCVLCRLDADRHCIFMHLTSPNHIAKYLESHAPTLSVCPAMLPQKNMYAKALQQAAAKYCEIYGRKKIREVMGNDFTDRGLVQPKATDALSNPQTATAAEPKGSSNPEKLQNLEKQDDRCRRRPSGFKDNGDFLGYLERFEIRNGEDASVLKRILQNCTQALEKFWEEQAPRDQLWEEPPGNPQGVADEGSSAVDFGSGAGQAAPEAQLDAMELFFSCIKGMEEAEVVGILHNIAATNPAFRGLNVPNTIRYLRATGRLKTS